MRNACATRRRRRRQSRPRQSFIAPERVYSRVGFLDAAGLNSTGVTLAKKEFGLELPTFSIGRRKFVNGADGIGYMRELSRLKERAKRESDANS